MSPSVCPVCPALPPRLDTLIQGDQPFGFIHVELFDHFAVEGGDGFAFGLGGLPGIQHAFGLLDFDLVGAEG